MIEFQGILRLSPVIHRIALMAVLLAVWLLWSGHYTALLITLGVLSVVAVVALAHRMGITDEEGAPIDLAWPALRYSPWLAWEIIKANIDVASRIVRPSLPISPRLIRVRADLRTDVGRAIYANSITLTPGTVSVEFEGDEIVVHALTREAAEGLQTGEMERRVRRLEGKG
jgi:multicomponent Na+:H+ antiporter subunit E